MKYECLKNKWLVKIIVTLKNQVTDYSLLILSTNSFGVSISILEKPNHFLPKSLMDAPM